MKKGLIIWMAAVLLFMTGCGRRDAAEEKQGACAQIAWAAYQYDQEYTPAEGWVYEMTISAGKQLETLKEMINAVSVKTAGEEMMVELGYRIRMMDSEGGLEQEMIVLQDGRISENGMICEAENVQPLLDWLDELKLDEQSVGD